MQGLKIAILAIFQTGLGWRCPFSAALKNPLLDSKNHFCIAFLAMLEGKTGKSQSNWKSWVEKAYSFRVQSSKITLCHKMIYSDTL